MPVWGSLYFQEGVSPVMEQLIFFHDHTMMVMILVVFLVGYILLVSIFEYFFNRFLLQGQELESFWTVLPGIFLLFIAFPSLRLLYMMEEMDEPVITIKVMGHQWYWSYEYGGMQMDSQDSYMLVKGQFRLLDVDNSLVVPYKLPIRLLISSMDVIHSWTLPVLGVKADGVPGRLNQLMVYFNRPGIYYGQCSEICGINHSFMPIKVSVVSVKKFIEMF
uniref:Cytochrome c oxidase subunit 2 n=1 Tax=Atypus karschi TaxID=2337319 RepID=A0A8A5Y908_9ARAC|nr:cytochrome c oxidase subunit II [Atypus karschi]QTH31096.1 cytochrome c oxidase subunit 2 [Atypus karschi]